LRPSGTLTGLHLDDRATLTEAVRKPTGKLEICGSTAHNLRDVDVDIPLGCPTRLRSEISRYTIPGDKLTRILLLKFKISAVARTRTYGKETTLASLAKSVGLSVEVLSIVPDNRDFRYLVSLAAAAKLAMTPHPVSGNPPIITRSTRQGSPLR